ncbi:undecaprenyldiphospho-muramoylpentapeptide beta-N-acetylglucosaminyltransferase [Myroides sp. LJL110]
MNTSKIKVIISGGGTGGHIYPALAIANEIKSRYPQADILFVGAKGKMEMQKVPQAGYPIKGLWISGLQRKLTVDNLMFPFKVVSSLYNSRKIIKSFKPDVVIGTGGFASGPVVKMANMMGIKTVIQEQNSFPGLTNKLLGKKVDLVFVAYDGLDSYFDRNKLIKTGNPVREDLISKITDKQQAKRRLELDPHKQTLLVIGGSLGARRINELIKEQLDFFIAENWQILWQCGKLYYEDYKKYNSNQIQVREYIDQMEYAYACADLVISRAGASTVSELALVGKPVIFIPSPNVAEDHQTKNAQNIVSQGAAVMIKERELENFKEIFSKLSKDQTYLNQLGNNFKAMGLPQATKQIVDKIIQLIN